MNAYPTPRLERVAGWLTVLIPPALVIGNAAAEIVAGLVVILFAWRCIVLRDGSWLRQGWVKMLLAVWVLGVTRALLTEHPHTALPEAVGWLRFVVLAVALQTWTLADERWQQRLTNAGLLSLAWLAGDAIFQYLHGTDLFGRRILFPHRLTASYPKPIVGIMLAWQFVPYAFGDLARGRSLRALAMGVLALVAIVLSGERMALLLSLMSLLLLMLALPSLRRAGVAILLLFVLGTGALMLAKPQLYDRQVTSTLTVIRDLPDSPYGVIWRSAIDIVADHPLTGVGMGNFGHVCPEPQYGPINAGAFGYPRCAPHPHNIYLEWLVETGIVGLTGFVVAMVLVLGVLWRDMRRHSGDMLSAALTVTLFVRLWPLASSTSFFHGWSAIPFWLVLGWALARVRPMRETA